MKTIINVMILILITLIKVILLPVIFAHEIATFNFDFSCWSCIMQNINLCVFDKRNFDKMYFVFK